jgi:uncharacterized membrane protein
MAAAASPPNIRPREALSGARIDSVDVLRGLVMVIMALDHARDFAHIAGLQDPSNLQTTTVPIFLTRLVTHLCAPTFVFLAGCGAYLQLLRGKSRGSLSKFLVTRGLWLIVLEFTLVRLAVDFDFDPIFVGIAQVIWVIGVGMILLAAFVWLPTVAAAIVGVGMVAIHNAFDGVRASPWGGPGNPLPSAGDYLWTVLHQPGMLPVAADGTPFVFVLYPLIPWIGVLLAGYAFGAIFRYPPERRVVLIGTLGSGLLAIFVLLRFLNVYGNPEPWSPQRSAAFTVLSFLKVEKYPPSLLFLCLTLGVALVLLAWFEHRALHGKHSFLERTLVVFGRVPLFFYMLQWIGTHGGALLLMVLAGKNYTRLLYDPLLVPRDIPPSGFSLPVVYALWITVVVLLYFPCRWFADLRSRRRDWWLSYL